MSVGPNRWRARRVLDVVRIPSVRSALVLTSALLVSAPVAAGAPGAATNMTCSFSPSERLVRLNVATWEDTAGFRVGPKDAELFASRVFFDDTVSSGLAEEPIACAGGTPSVTSVDRLAVSQTESRGDYSAAAFLLDLSEGGLAPGVTAEPVGLPEIEADFDLPGGAVAVLGTSDPDQYALGFTADELGLSLNADDDLDITLRGVTFFNVYGAAGADSIDGRRSRITERPRRDIRVFLNGGPGDDRLIAGGKRDQLSGGGGADVLKGGKAAAVLQGGGGPDRLTSTSGSQLLLGGNGADRIDARDGDRDDIDCGGGDDTAIVDRREGPIPLEGCEHVKRAG